MHPAHSFSHPRESARVNARDETRRDCPRAPHELAKRDALIRSTTNTRHHFKNAPFLFYLFGSSRANTSVDGVARAPSISRGETTRRPSRRGHTNLDHARDATERIDARTHDAFGAFTLHVKITSRRRLARRVAEWRVHVPRRLDTEPAPRDFQSAPSLRGVFLTSHDSSFVLVIENVASHRVYETRACVRRRASRASRGSLFSV